MKALLDWTINERLSDNVRDIMFYKIKQYSIDVLKMILYLIIYAVAGTILSAEPHPETDNLLVCIVKCGDEPAEDSLPPST